MNIKKLILVVLIAGTVIALPFINRTVFGTDSKEVNVSNLSNRIISPSILASGFLTHEEEVMLSSEVIGKVSELYVEEGDRVSIGQLLLQVDDKNFIAGLEQSEAAVRINSIDIERQQVRIENLRRQFARSQSLHERNMIGDDEFDNVRNQLDLAIIDLKSSEERFTQANAQLDQVNDQLSKTKILSPIDGLITSLDIKVGETAIASATNIPGSSLMTIANPESIYTEVLVDEADVATVEIGQRVEIVAIAYPDQPMQGVVRYIANTAKIAPGRQGLSFTVKIDITDAGDVVLRPGMSSRAEIFTRQDQEVAAVPIQAIIFEEDRAELRSEYFIFVNDGGIARKTKIEVGISDDEYQELVSNIDDNIEIIVGPDQELRHLLEGDRIDTTVIELQ
ncbi:MAG: efflux RND transporter periplasmic adaptor subunit [Gammaproteobacteria bacterium]|jgi:HlyD family secretion protein|nr:efflux RND transporter periplasmic adaptor subunit [Gammaproteobacteria bacterium]MBT3859650.1 efflux RND transporter periplasmic adaptor subunit [Gammaproteobacteria bacterium]MBT3987623.1 efflux RND transporter periplasmic adaptor subunit [Gammaproteobacteria bacterium]MBT4254766.1 efflux RND transporter periplasmic adaptor subunit [Gammaproteobacteria bacterium]MBT4581637.1 efflux RND transporter periplasmic adaptor subunit [Gammaproteobacteria bacterium]